MNGTLGCVLLIWESEGTGEKQWIVDLVEEAVQSSGICDSMEELKLFISVIKKQLIIS